MTLLAVALAAGGLIALSTVAGFALNRHRERCPACTAKALRSVSYARATSCDDGKRYPANWSDHRCTACKAEFHRYNGGPFIPDEAWRAGAREPPPKATIVPRRES